MRTGGKPGAGSMLTQRTLQGECPLEMSSTIGRRRQFLSSKASQQPCLCGHEFKRQNTPVTSTYLVERLLIFSVTIDIMDNTVCTMRNGLALCGRLYTLVVVFEFHDNFPNWVGQYPNGSNFLF